MIGSIRAVRVTALVLLASAVILVGCSSSSADDRRPPSAPPDGAVIVARDTAFDRSELRVPAGRRFALLLDNRDGAPHNVTIFDESGDQPFFVGEIFGGPGWRAYEVPAIPAGRHRFRCDVHPQMAGVVVAESR